MNDLELKSINNIIKGKKITNIYNIEVKKNKTNISLNFKKYPVKINSSIKSKNNKNTSNSISLNNNLKNSKNIKKIEKNKIKEKRNTLASNNLKDELKNNKKLKTLQSNNLKKKKKLINKSIKKKKKKKKIDKQIKNDKIIKKYNIIKHNEVSIKSPNSLKKPDFKNIYNKSKNNKKIKISKKPKISIKPKIKKLNKDTSAKIIQKWWKNSKAKGKSNKNKIKIEKEKENNTKYKLSNIKWFAKEEYKNWNKLQKMLSRYKNLNIKNASKSKILNMFEELHIYSQNLKEKIKDKFNFNESNLLSTKRINESKKTNGYMNKDLNERYPNNFSQSSIINLNSSTNNILVSKDNCSKEPVYIYKNKISNDNKIWKHSISGKLIPILNINNSEELQNDSKKSSIMKDTEERLSSYKSNEYEAIEIPFDCDNSFEKSIKINNIHLNKITNTILENLLENIISDSKYNIIINELNNNQYISLDKIYGIRTNINSIDDYISLLINFLIEENIEEIKKLLNKNIKNIFINKLNTLYLNKFKNNYNEKIILKFDNKFVNNELELYKKDNFLKNIISIDFYNRFEDNIWEQYDDLKIDDNLLILQRIYHRCLFDCFNEKLKELLFYDLRSNNYIDMIKKNNLLFVKQLNNYDVEKIFNSLKHEVINNSSYCCGIIRDKEDSMLGNIRYLDDKTIDNLKQERLENLMDNYCNEFHIKNKENNKFSLFIYFEISELILESLIDDMCQFINI